GSGKTTLTRALLDRLPSTVATALIVHPQLAPHELIRAILRDFGIPIRSLLPQRMLESLRRFLLRIAEGGGTALVIIDEAQLLSRETLEAVRLLTNFETDKQKLLQILLVGQPELAETLAGHDLRQLRQRIALRLALKPMSFDETERYVHHRLERCSGERPPTFESGALRTIHRESGGYPRLVNMMCDRALVASFVRERFVVDRPTVELAVKDIRGDEGLWKRWGRRLLHVAYS
ncbi:MAG: AAA family ATPase, partial [Deltaproteobacteria bacterium]|nr:AAA family ATPase [Deltaproteobacteria bacterium]